MPLTAEALQIRLAIVASKPAGTFDAVMPILEDYCLASALQDSLCALVGDRLMSAAELTRFDKLAQLKCSLATKLRITNQSRYTPKAAATACLGIGSGAGKPWGSVK